LEYNLVVELPNYKFIKRGNKKMLDFDEYKRIVGPIMDEIVEAERDRRVKFEELRNELTKIKKSLNLKDRKKIDGLLDELEKSIYNQKFR